mmetsp:Transcript_65457/g.202571  ORF Transcript_65457/g.202571 Transcript_65457/m.202571 type:complete len:236 (+) Transcript_65457:1389-2096(+)
MTAPPLRRSCRRAWLSANGGCHHSTSSPGWARGARATRRCWWLRCHQLDAAGARCALRVRRTRPRRTTVPCLRTSATRCRAPPGTRGMSPNAVPGRRTRGPRPRPGLARAGPRPRPPWRPRARTCPRQAWPRPRSARPPTGHGIGAHAARSRRGAAACGRGPQARHSRPARAGPPHPQRAASAGGVELVTPEPPTSPRSSRPARPAWRGSAVVATAVCTQPCPPAGSAQWRGRHR